MQTKSALTGSLQPMDQQWSCNSTTAFRLSKGCCRETEGRVCQVHCGQMERAEVSEQLGRLWWSAGRKAQEGQQSVGKAPGETRNLQYGRSALKVHFRDIQKNKNRREREKGRLSDWTGSLRDQLPITMIVSKPHPTASVGFKLLQDRWEV